MRNDVQMGQGRLGRFWSGFSDKFASLSNSAVKTVQMADLNLWEDSARIAFVGSSRSGKTVLLTSLIDHLRNHDPRRFRLTPNPASKKATARIVKYEILEVHPGLAPFPFDAFRQSLLQDARWPQKTRDTFQYRIKIHRDDSLLSRVKEAPRLTNLTFLDFAGERIADALMTTASYGQWSDFQLAGLPAEPCFKQSIDAYNSVVENPESAEEIVLMAYKAILVERLKHFHSSVSPSTFMLSPEGSIPESGMPFDRMLKDRFTGLSKNDQFCPLPIQIREKRPDLTKRWEQAYEGYRQKLILPLYRALRDSDRLCMLINIPEILQSGVGAYNDQIDLLRHVLAYCAPSDKSYLEILRGISKSVGKVFIDDKFRPGGIEKVAFVATQADRVRAQDMDLLNDLVRKIQIHSTRSLPFFQLPMESFACAAVQSTKATGKEQLQGRLVSRSASEDTQPEVKEFHVSPLPDDWPPDWDPSAYCFPEVWPAFNKNRNFPPIQSGLDRIFNYLTQ